MATDMPSTFSKDADSTKIVGFDMTQLAARKAFKKANVTSQDIQVVELHDCFSCNELITYEALGLCEAGKAVEMVKSGNNTYGGKYVINPSGGLISKGHPLGATGIAQCCELTWQLRGEAGKRQVNDVRYCLSHNIGLGGAAVVGIYKRAFSENAPVQKKTEGTKNSQASMSLQEVTSQHKSGRFFDEIQAKLKEDSSLVGKVKAVVGFTVALDNGKEIAYVVDLEKAPGSVFVNDGS